MVTRIFDAMGTSVTLHVDGPPGSTAEAAFDRAEAAFAEIETTCTRFDQGSELMRLNRSGEAEVSSLLGELLAVALAGRERTGGLFDPTVHDAVVAAGYDRTFEEVKDGPEAPPVRAGGSVVLREGRVTLGAGTRLDLGGIAKGFAVDRACAILAELGPCLVDAGGDIAVRGTWPVAVDGGPTLELTDAAVATSGRDRRAWNAGDRRAHHLIDPRLGRPAVTQTVRASVVAATATEAEVLATAAFLGGEISAPAVLVLETGEVVLAGGLG